MAGPAAAMAAGGAADAAKEVDVAGVADSAQKSKGLQIAVAVIGLAILYYVYTGVNFATDVGEDAADGTTDALRGAGDVTSDSLDWFLGGGADATENVADATGDVADGTGDVLADGVDWTLGGSADVVEGTGDVVEDGTDYVLGGTADTVENVGSWAGGLVS